jgi:TM2 domain-containing membrane protein YozV
MPAPIPVPLPSPPPDLPPTSIGAPDYHPAAAWQGTAAPTPTPYVSADQTAPYGRDPVSGQPLSDKSAVVAGLLQLFFGAWGIGRFYIGDRMIGFLQLGSFLVSVALIFVLIGFFTLPCVALWVFIDGIMMIMKKVPDSNGRQLR